MLPEHKKSRPGNRRNNAALVSDKMLKAGQVGQLINGDNIQLSTQDQPAQLLVLASLPLQEPVAQSGLFVMNSIKEIEQGFRDYRDGVLTQ